MEEQEPGQVYAVGGANMKLRGRIHKRKSNLYSETKLARDTREGR